MLLQTPSTFCRNAPHEGPVTNEVLEAKEC